MIELEVTLLRANSKVDKRFFEVWDRTGVPATSATLPQFVTIPAQNWTTGETISFFLGDYLAFLPPGSAVAYAVSPLSTPLSALPNIQLDVVTGEVYGLIADQQGGTYNFVFLATGSFGTVQSSLAVGLVSLEITAPTWKTTPDHIPDFTTDGNQQVGAAFTPIFLRDYVLYDGDPASTQVLTYAEVGTFLATQGLSLNATTSEITGTLADDVTTRTITVNVTNGEGLTSANETFDIKIFALAGGSETPVFSAWHSGLPNCDTAVVPVWSSDGDRDWKANITDATTKEIDLLGGYLAWSGGSAVTGVDYASGSDELPAANWTLQKTAGGAGLGFITRTATVNAENESLDNISFVATNVVGPSADSPVFTLTFIDNTVAPPTITGISGTEGTNTVYVQFSEDVFIDPADGAVDYTLGFDWAVNGDSKTPTYVGGAGSSRFEYTLAGLTDSVLSGNNTLGLDYTT